MSRIANLAPFVLVMSILAAVTLTGCSSGKESGTEALVPTSGGPTPSNGLVQSNSEGGAVTIDVRWLGEKDGLLVFNVEINTHSVDLDQYDLGKLATLRDDAANELRPISWDSASSGHHRSGTLTFPVPDSLGQGDARYLEMVIRGIAGIETRTLRWQL